MTVLPRLGLLLKLLFFIVWSAQASAAPDPKMQMLFIGLDPAQSALGALPPELPVIAIEHLPMTDLAQQAVFAARLRASPVSTFVTEPSATDALFEQFYLVTEIELLSDPKGYQVGLGGEHLGLTEFADRVSAVVEAFNPTHRRIGFIRVQDPADEFPLAISEVQTALNRIGFDMMVVMIGSSPAAQSCAPEVNEALHFSLVNGLADRAPFGNGDGVSTAQEVESYLTGALNRRMAREPVCGPKYSLILKGVNDPSQELVAYKGRSAFTEMETGLYNETFEAMFLMESDDRVGVEEFLASCLYCPNEKALTDRLRDMEEFARASALEEEIWQRIRGDAKTARLAIYLQNCALCAFRDEVEARIAEIEAKEAAFDAEARAFEAAVDARDIAALRSYADGCIACAHRDSARALVTEIETDTAYQLERATLEDAVSKGNPAALKVYLETCQICDGREAVAEALVLAEKRAEAAEPCLRLAGVPQLGGPRKLEAIDQVAATRVCGAAADDFPGDGLIQTTMGRIAQAAGDYRAARNAYAAGMEADVPAAYGLAAYAHYAPPPGEQIDLDSAEELARMGAEHGDWLSQEILTVLYSKDLIPGKTPTDAFAIARNIAAEGNPLAQFFVGYYYLTGTGVNPSAEEAEKWLSKSVDQGYLHAVSFLAEIYETGDIPSPERAAELYWSALEMGDPTATDRLTTQLGNRDREVVRIIQQKLRDQGVYRGSVDGIAGPGTVTAIQEFSQSLNQQG